MSERKEGGGPVVPWYWALLIVLLGTAGMGLAIRLLF